MFYVLQQYTYMPAKLLNAATYENFVIIIELSLFAIIEQWSVDAVWSINKSSKVALGVFIFYDLHFDQLLDNWYVGLFL